MTQSPDTGPAVSRHEQHRAWEREWLRDQQNRVVDARVTSVFKWCTTILGVLFTAGLIWMVSTLVNVDKNTALLLARPETVSKIQHDADMNEIKSEINGLRAELREVRTGQLNGRPAQ